MYLYLKILISNVLVLSSSFIGFNIHASVNETVVGYDIRVFSFHEKFGKHANKRYVRIFDSGTEVLIEDCVLNVGCLQVGPKVSSEVFNQLNELYIQEYEITRGLLSDKSLLPDNGLIETYVLNFVDNIRSSYHSEDSVDAKKLDQSIAERIFKRNLRTQLMNREVYNNIDLDHMAFMQVMMREYNKRSNQEDNFFSLHVVELLDSIVENLERFTIQAKALE